MMIPPSFTCDAPGCRASKTPTSANGWWLARAHAPSGMLLEPWTMAEAMIPDTKHYCGAACLVRAWERRQVVGGGAPPRVDTHLTAPFPCD